jgi:hypothetical protein
MMRRRCPKLPEFRQPRDDGTHYTTWLVVGYQAGDDGTRPLQGGTVFWESPNVWVVSSAGVNQPVPGEANTVFARVANLGLQDATGVYVRFWWADPSLAITEANAHQINPQNLPAVSVPSLSSVVVQCPDPWIPIFENNGHECLFAEAYIPGFDELNAPLDPVDDRHVGQKNEQLILSPRAISSRPDCRQSMSLGSVSHSPSRCGGCKTRHCPSWWLRAPRHCRTVSCLRQQPCRWQYECRRDPASSPDRAHYSPNDCCLQRCRKLPGRRAIALNRLISRTSRLSLHGKCAMSKSPDKFRSMLGLVTSSPLGLSSVQAAS